METEKPILSVTEISLSLKACVEQVFSDVRVRGEVVGAKKVSSGHTYFSLKEGDSVLSAICWRGRDAQTANALVDGLEIIATGKLSTYPGRSNYQMIVDKAEPAGVGALLKLLNERKAKLEKEGLFDASRKKPIPYLPEVIGVITSPSGAVIRDIMHRLNDRFPRRVLLWPVPVQGEGAAEQIAAAIDGFNAIEENGVALAQGVIPRPDLLIVARGGGSFEDLWCFNEEIVVRAAARSQIPLISAVGHETDTTLIDYVADLRAPTPTGAAEKAVPVRAELLAFLEEAENRLSDGLYRAVESAQNKLEVLTHRLPDLSEIINAFYTRLDEQAHRLKSATAYYMKTADSQWDLLSKLLDSYSYKSVLKRGFALVMNQAGQALPTVRAAKQERLLSIHFSDGTLVAAPQAEMRESKANTGAGQASESVFPQPALKRQKRKTAASAQPDLFFSLSENNES